MTEKVSEKMLMALADGELDADTTRDLLARLAVDPVLRARYARYERSAAAVREVFADVLAEAPPKRLARAVLEAGGVRARAAERSRVMGGWAALPLAATVALAVGLGFLLGRGTGGGEGVPDAFAGMRVAAGALAGHVSGEVVALPDGSRAAVIASFDSATGPCRHIQTRSADGQVWESLGCRGADGWDIALVLPPGAGGGYVPAEGASAGAMDAYLEGIGASGPLTPEAEAEQVSGGWARAR